ncbi:heparinase II/III domain-containing protein [Cognaticolwellia beringensis]|uniref:Alginate lyase n=1 Tax=Cognaticolwellia beringensis TaxID=1967665 RepID=A0A222GF56_9GAMM|nr:heparinase II/III family protein [Cognaticolwellia beringensis]ASP50014.1 alginate lyase [Cognaticolwellia beringensis]
MVVFTLLASTKVMARTSPNLVISTADVKDMRGAIQKDGQFTKAFVASKLSVDEQIAQVITVPLPADGGGGYTHERHKKNYKLMYDAGIVYQLTQDEKYASYVRDMLLEYAKLYPTLPLHPKRKMGKQNPGKLFWQSLNEAVWLVYTSQAYDLILSSLTANEKTEIENGLFRPVVKFLSVESPETFNKVHNHGTWTTAAVGMTGYVLGEQEWVEQALYGLDKSGTGGFLRQLDELFSPQGYYNEGPYYQRYALMPFVTFAKAIQTNQPEREIFQYRDGIVLKAIDTTIQLSYNKLFFPINDAIKSKGIDTIELVNGVTIAYGLTEDSSLLDIARQQDQVILTGDGLKVANALDKNLDTSYKFKSVAFGDGNDGKQGALVVMRQDVGGEQAVLFKPAAQGLGHGHFDKLTWQFYDKGEEIVSDYGAARFLNVEAKYGGRYLPENDTWAKQTVAHNTVVVDEKSHFNANVEMGNANHPELLFFAKNEHATVSSAQIDSAYKGVSLKRTMALINLPRQSKQDHEQSLVVDIFDVNSNEEHQYDLPVHFKGHLISTNFTLATQLTSLPVLGKENGYQHLWLKAQAQPKAGLAQITWLNDNGRFYTSSSIMDGDASLIFSQIGANDPLFNLRNENAYITRKSHAKNHTFVSVLEPHGEYNPSKEFTISAVSKVEALTYKKINNIDLVDIVFSNNKHYLLAVNTTKNNQLNTFSFNGSKYQFDGRFKLFDIKQ